MASSVFGQRTAPNPNEQSRWEKEIQAFEKMDFTNAPPKDAILFVGSSSIRLWTSLTSDFPKHNVINRGFGGSQIKDSSQFAERIIFPYRPKQIVLYAGDNDIAAGLSPEQVLIDFKDFVQKVRSKLPSVKIAFISIKPSLSRWKLVDKVREANRLVENYCKQESGLQFIDIFPAMLDSNGKPREDLLVEDGLHLNAKGYAIWAETVRPFLNK